MSKHTDNLIGALVDICTPLGTKIPQEITKAEQSPGESRFLYCRTHDGYYTPPRCSPLCTLLGSWSEPQRFPVLSCGPNSAERQEGKPGHAHQGAGLRREGDFAKV